MSEDEIRELIRQTVSDAIREHEVRVGWISGLIGIFFVFGIVHAIWLMKLSLL